MIYRDQKQALRALTVLAGQQGGYFTAKQAAENGYGPTHLAYHLKTGNFEHAGHGLYRIATLPPAEHDDLVRLWLWSRGRDDQPQATVSHQTALSLHGLTELIPAGIHLTVPPGFRKRPPKGCRLHKADLPASDFRQMWGVTVTSPLRTLTDLAVDRSISDEQFSKAVRSATQRGLIRGTQARTLQRSRSSL
jgi:predicted transcriptional regulator of viral defense system